MKYGSLTVRRLGELTDEEIKLGIEIGAQREYEVRVDALARYDWTEAVNVVRRRQEKGQKSYPSGTEVRPVAEKIYQRRMEEEWLACCRLAQRNLKDLGQTHPNHSEVLSLAAAIAEENRQALQDRDYIVAEEKAMESGIVWFPGDRIPAKKKAPQP